MNWNGKRDRQVLKRIVALLFAFAALADLAGSKPRPVRAAVLWILRSAEAIAEDFVSGMVEDCGCRVGRPVQLSLLDERDQCIRLAQSPRTLAGLLDDLLHWGLAPLPSGRNGSAIPDLMLTLRKLVADRPALAHATLEPPCIDSS